MRISDWISDVCSSDLSGAFGRTSLRLRFMDEGPRESPFRWNNFEKRPARQRRGDSRFNRFLIQGELNIWVRLENEGPTCLLGGCSLSSWGRYPVFLGAVTCPGGGYRSFGSKARNRGLRAPSPALPRWFPTPMARSMRLGVTPSLPDDRRCDSILSFWGPLVHTPRT